MLLLEIQFLSSGRYIYFFFVERFGTFLTQTGASGVGGGVIYKGSVWNFDVDVESGIDVMENKLHILTYSIFPSNCYCSSSNIILRGL